MDKRPSVQDARGRIWDEHQQDLFNSGGERTAEEWRELAEQLWWDAAALAKAVLPTGHTGALSPAELLAHIQAALPEASPADLYVAVVDAALSPYAAELAAYHRAMTARSWDVAEQALDAAAARMDEGHPVVVGYRVHLGMTRE